MKNPSRRTFMKGCLAGAAGAAFAPYSRVLGANDDVRVAVVGFRSQGSNHIKWFGDIPGVRVVALCDVDRQLIDREVKKLKERNVKVDTYTDVRKLLEDRNIDAIITATPNHWHSLVTVWACQAGKDVYVEKPVSHNISEGRRMVEAARKYNRIVQAGTQRRSDEGLMQAFEYIRQGHLGKILRARCYYFSPRGPIGKVDGPQPVPETVDYDLWMGPAPMAPLMRRNLHYDWHWQWPYGNGDLGNNGIHFLDVCRWALGYSTLAPRVMSFGGKFLWDDDRQTPNTQVAFFDYEPAPIIFEMRNLPRKKGDSAMDLTYRRTRADTVIECEGGYFAGGWAYDYNDEKIRKATIITILLLPSHGPVVREPKPQLREYQEKLRRLERMLVRGYPVKTFAAADQDRVSTPTAVPHLWQVTPHLFKFKGPDFSPNFGLILADNGHGLVVDCGLLDAGFLDRSIEMMRERLGLKKIDATIITHMHGDHVLEAPHLREKYGAEIWTLDRIADKFEHPERHNYAASVQTYGRDFESVHIDRVFKSGETFEWAGYKFTVDWMPGQTEFALCLHGDIDGRKVAFTGDNIFANSADPSQTGHEALVAHNSAILEEGYIYAADYLRRLKPDLIVGGHSFVMDRPAALIERFGKWALDMRSTFQSLSADDDYRYWFDPFWVRAEPYRVTLKRGQSGEVLVCVRNFRNVEQKHRIEIHAPSGVIAEPAVLEGKLTGESQGAFGVSLKAASDARVGVAIVALDVSLDGRRYGQWFDFIVEVK